MLLVANDRWWRRGAGSSRSAPTPSEPEAQEDQPSLSPGTYTVKAVFTPTPAFRDNYPVATMSKVITIRPPR